MAVLISPVSTQVYPVIVSALALSPDKVILLSTEKMKRFETYIQRVLKYRLIEVEIKRIKPYDSSSVVEAVKNIPANAIFLLNCGTKITAITLFDLAGKEKSIYYKPDGSIVNFEGKVLTKVKENLIDVELHSAMYGFEIKSEISDVSYILRRKKLTKYIALNYKRFLSQFKKAYQQQYFDIHSLPSDFFRLAEDSDVIFRQRNRYIIIDKGYIGGKWLEEFLFINLIEKDFYDIHIGVVIRWYDSEITNEVDILAIKNNTLHVFSCKTGNKIHTFNKHLFELNEISKRIGGDFAKKFLCIAVENFQKKKPTSKDFPSIPKEKFSPESLAWKNYYLTKEGKHYKEAFSSYKSFSYLNMRAKLLEIDIITVEDLLSGKSLWGI